MKRDTAVAQVRDDALDTGTRPEPGGQSRGLDANSREGWCGLIPLYFPQTLFCALNYNLGMIFYLPSNAPQCPSIPQLSTSVLLPQS